MNKKGAIELSITGVVVLIIAITVLGLVLAFVGGFFEKAKGWLETPSSAIEQQRYEVVLNDPSEVTFEPGYELKVKKASTKSVLLAIRNTPAVENCYKVEFLCKDSYSGTGCINNEREVKVSGEGAKETWFKVPSKWTIGPAKKIAKPVDVSIDSAGIGKYDMSLNVYKAKKEGECSENTEFNEKAWKEKTFVLEVTG